MQVGDVVLAAECLADLTNRLASLEIDDEAPVCVFGTDLTYEDIKLGAQVSIEDYTRARQSQRRMQRNNHVVS